MLKKSLLALALVGACLQPAFGNEDVSDMAFENDAVGEAIGGVIGDILDRTLPRPGRDEVVCFAQNRRGEMFRARGRNQRVAQERAVEKCYDVSRFCRPMGCRGGNRW